MSDKEELVFDLALKEMPFQMKNLDGELINYVIIELDGAKRDTFMNDVLRRTGGSVSGGGTKIKDFKGMHSKLIALSIQVLDPDGKRKPVPEDEIQKWPASVQAKVFAECQKLSALENVEEDAPDPLA